MSKVGYFLNFEYEVIIIIMLFILTQTSFFLFREVGLIRVRNPVDVFFSIFIKLILPGPGFEPVISRVNFVVTLCLEIVKVHL
jgi:hypothetical protein